MAGSKTAAKKKKPSAADSQELKRVQAWVADGLKVTDVTELLAYVGQNCQGTSPRLQLLGSLYLLLRKWPPTAKDVTPQLLNQLEQLSGAANREFEESASGQKPALVWGWAALVALGKLGAAASGKIQKDLYGKVVSTLQPTMKVTDPQGWLEQWQLPQEFPASVEQEAAAGSSQQLAAYLGWELLRAYMEAAVRTGTKIYRPTLPVMISTLKDVWEGKEAPKADAKSGKAAAGKQPDKSKDKKDAAAAKQATAMQLQRETSPKQPQQQKRTKDTDRVKDAALRGTAGDDKAAQELAAHKELAAKAQEKADEVLKYLSESTLGAKFSSLEEHISALQSKVAIEAKDFKDCIGTLRRHDPSASSGKDVKKGEAKGDLYEETQAKGILKLYRDQFGIAAGDQEAGKLLTTQLEQAVEKGSWLVYTEGEEGAKSGKDKAYFSSLGEFLQHVQKEYLDGKLAQADLETYGMICRDNGPGLLDAYNMDFGNLLADEAARALGRTKKAGSDQANGFHLEENAWMQAFSEDCPLRRYLLHTYRTPVLTLGDVAEAVASVTTLPELSLDKMSGTGRQYAALGFALLQLQRNQIVVGVEDLSTAPDWQVKAYQCLKVLLPLNGTNVTPDHLDFVIFHYFEVEQPEPTQDLCEMLDPEVYLAAQAAAGSAGQAGTSTSEPSFSDGLTQDTVTMLQMLHEANALAEGPLQLALQVYACKVTGKPLPLPHKQGAAFRAEEVLSALELMDKHEAVELRSFLLQVLVSCFARLPKYMEFLEAVKDQRWRSRYLPVQMQGAGDKKQFALSRDFYAQACMAAAMPFDENVHCCSKHRRQRELAEADGGVFSRYTVDSPDDWQCQDVEAQTGPERTRILRRYILQAARVTEAQQQKELKPGTQQGLRALTRELIMTSEYDEKLPPVLLPETAQPRASWELCRFYLLLASQLAIHRQQLYKLVMFHEQNLDSHKYDAREMRQAERAVLQQRIAGMYFCYEAWAKWYEETAKVLQKELEAATKAKGQDKAGKGPKDAGRDAQGKNKISDKLHGEIEKSNNSRQAMQDGIRQLLKQSDMCAASASALTTSLTDAERGLQQTLELVVRELINAKPVPEPMQAGSLRKALQLSRMMLFELDVTIMQYVNAAHYAVLTNMWRFRQPAAAVVLMRYALGQHVQAEISEHKVALLIEAEESTKQQPAAGKAAGKKKKKKGPAVQQKRISIHTSDNEASEEEKEEAAAAESEGEDAAAQQQPDAVQLDPRFLAQFEQDSAAAAEPTSRSSGSGRAAAAAARGAADAADSGGEFKPVGRSGTAAASQQQPGRGQPPPQQQQRNRAAGSSAQTSSSSAAGGFRLVDGFWRGPGPLGECAFPDGLGGLNGTICWECGAQGHVPLPHCPTPKCGKCGHIGHATAECRLACPKCFWLHGTNGRCRLNCGNCDLFGHTSKFCPRSRCRSCGLFGHPSAMCEFCPRCHKHGHVAAECNAKQCDVCRQWDTCVVGSCINTPAAPLSSNSRAAQPRPAAPPSSSSSGSGGRAPCKPPPATVPQPQQVALLSVAQVRELPEQRRAELMEQLFLGGLDGIATSLVERPDELTELLRVPPAVMRQWLDQPDPGSYVQGMLDHLARMKSAGTGKEQQDRQQQQQREREQQERAEQQQRDQREQQGQRPSPSQLPDAAAAVFEAEFPPGALPADWRNMSWRYLEEMMTGRGGRGRGEFRKAKDKAAAAAAGVTAAAPVRRSSSGVVQQPLQQQQQQRFGGEPLGPRESSSSDADRDAAGEGAVMQQGAPGALPQDMTQQQQQQQTAAGVGLGPSSGPPQTALGALLAQRVKQQGAQAVPAHLQQHLPQQQQQQQQQPGGVTNSYSMPNPQLQQQQAGIMPPVDPAVAEADRRIRSQPLAPWMLWYSMGANKAVFELPESEEKHQLLRAMAQDMSGTYMNLEQFRSDILHLLQRKRGMPDLAAWREFCQLVVQALELGPPAQMQQQQQQQFPAAAPLPAAAPPPAAAAAGGPMLPPHLRGRGGLPPHLQQQQPQQQQQQDDMDSDDDDALLAMLGENTSAAATADGGASTWSAITGHAPEDATTSSADFPPLGSQSVSAEDADMARAIAASRANHVPGVSAAGLANQAGEYNCFLNVVVQCLWSCKEFTRAVRNLADHECSHPVVQALLNLFERMEAAESGWKPGQVRAVIDPSELRVALAQHTHFKCQEMNDANELLDTIYECFAQSQAPGETQGSRGILIDGVFGLLLSEKVVCRSCGKETHKVPQHYEHLVVVNSTSLSTLAMIGAASGMDNLLREMFDQEMKMCDKDEGGCGEPNPRYRELAMNPQVLTLQLVWDQNVSGDEIRNTLSQVEERLDITRMYNDLAVGDVTFRLTSAVAYYGQHYMAFVWNTTHNKWMMLDDANASLVGSWQDVINKCQAGKIQPGVLFYRLMDLSSIPDEAAPVQQQQLAPPVVHVPSSSSTSSASHYGAPGLGHHPGANVVAAPSHGFPAAMPAAAPAAAAAVASSGLPASSNWGARSRVASQQPPPAAAAAASGPPSTGTPWGNKLMAAAGFDDADMADAAPLYPLADTGDSWTYDVVESQADSSNYNAGVSSSGDFSSSAGPPGAPSRLSGSGDGYAASPARSHPTATGPGATAAGGFGPAGRLAGNVFRDVLGQQGPVGTGPRSAGTGPGGLDRNGSGSNAAPGAYAGGRGNGRAGAGRGPGMGRGGEEPEWGRVGGRGRGRGRGY